MRVLMLAFVAALGLVASPLLVYGAPLATTGSLLAPGSKMMLAASPSCPKGQRWVPAGYAKHGKYRAGHCAPK